MSVRKQLPDISTDSNSNHRLLAYLHSEIEKVFERCLATLPEETSQPEVSSQSLERASLNLFETDKGVDIECDLSSQDGENIKVSASKDCLIIETTTEESPNMNFYLGDPSVESIRKVIPLGFPIGPHSFRTQCRNGMLAVHVDKPHAGIANRRKVIEA